MGVGLLLVVFLTLLIGPLVAPYSPSAVGVGPSAQGPTAEHLLGTDDLGRDVLSRLLTGGWSVVAVPVFAVTIAFLIAGLAGIGAAYVGGRGERVIVRIVDVLLPIPPLLIALVVMTGTAGGFLVMSVVVGLVFVPRMTRVLRGAAQQVVTMEYIQAAQARGERRWRVLATEISPNIAGPMLVEYGIRLNFAVAFIASLNYLGFGAQPPSSNWALMVAESVDILAANPWAAIAPMIALAILVVGINLVTDAATHALSPEMRRVITPE